MKKMAKMTKIMAALTQDASGIKGQRASNLAAAMEAEHKKIVLEIEDRKRQVEMKLLDLNDLSPENTFSLRPGREDFDPAVWASTIQKLKLELLEIQVELKAAESTTNDWFVEVTESEEDQE